MNSARKPRRVRRRQRERQTVVVVRMGDVTESVRERQRKLLAEAYANAARDAWERGV